MQGFQTESNYFAYVNQTTKFLNPNTWLYKLEWVKVSTEELPIDNFQNKMYIECDVYKLQQVSSKKCKVEPYICYYHHDSDLSKLRLYKTVKVSWRPDFDPLAIDEYTANTKMEDFLIKERFDDYYFRSNLLIEV